MNNGTSCHRGAIAIPVATAVTADWMPPNRKWLYSAGSFGIGAFATVSFQSEIIERLIWKTRRLFAPALIEAIPRDGNVHDVLAVDALSRSGRGSGRDEKRHQVLLSRVAESSGWSA